MIMPRLELQPDDSILLWVKAVPGASRDQISGVLGERLKIRIAAPPEDGRANRAICQCMARALGIKSSQVQVHSGAHSPEKTLAISGVSVEQLRRFIEEIRSGGKSGPLKY
jgi:uncharacterized protein (TIGR00251 family)